MKSHEHVAACPFSASSASTMQCAWCRGYRRGRADGTADRTAARYNLTITTDALLGAALPSDAERRGFGADADAGIVCALSRQPVSLTDHRCRLCRWIGRGHVVEADYFRVSCRVLLEAPRSCIVRGATWRADHGANLRTESMVAALHVERTQRPLRKRSCSYVPDEMYEHGTVSLETESYPCLGSAPGGVTSCC